MDDNYRNFNGNSSGDFWNQDSDPDRSANRSGSTNDGMNVNQNPNLNMNQNTYQNINQSQEMNQNMNRGMNMNQGSAYDQTNYYTYDRKAQKRAANEEKKRARAEAKARYKASKSGSFASTLGKCAAVALVFGLVGGSAFSGVVYFTGASDKMQQTFEAKGDVTPGIDTSQAPADIPEAGITSGSTIDSTNLIQATTLPDVSEMVEQTMPSVVAITKLATVTQMSWFGQQITSEAEYAGSGIIVAEDGDYLYIATNDHVVTGADTLTVEFVDGETANAEIKGSYATDDLSVIMVNLSDLPDDTKNAIRIAKINDSGDYKVGSSVIAIGNALGYGQSVTSGIISALDREITFGGTSDGRTYTNTVIQTDASINPGNSGGALINAAGEVIGMNEGGADSASADNVGFAIPMSTLKPLIDNIIERELAVEGEESYIGIVGVDVDQSVANTYGMPTGVYIAKITNNSPAANSQLLVGDILTAIDNNKVGSMEELDEILTFYSAGTDVTLTVYRANAGVYEEVQIPLTLGLRSDYESTPRRTRD